MFEMKVDGRRTVMWRTGDGVRLQARSGRDVTAVWKDLALTGLPLPAGTVLDGEAIIVTEDGRISFEAAQARAASSPSRARLLATGRPAHYIVWDVLHLPSRDTRARPYREWRAALLYVLAGLPVNSPIQAVTATSDRQTALTWYNTLQGQGVEGLVAKRAVSPYRAGRSAARQKIRHAETVDAEVVGYTGPATRPRTPAEQLPDGRTALTQKLAALLAGQIAPLLTAAARRPHQQRSALHPRSSVETLITGPQPPRTEHLAQGGIVAGGEVRDQARVGGLPAEPPSGQCTRRWHVEGEHTAYEAETIRRRRLDRHREHAADSLGQRPHCVAPVGYRVQDRAGRSVLECDAEQPGGVEPVDRWPALRAIADVH